MIGYSTNEIKENCDSKSSGVYFKTSKEVDRFVLTLHLCPMTLSISMAAVSFIFFFHHDKRHWGLFNDYVLF